MPSHPQSLESWVRAYEAHLSAGGVDAPDAFAAGGGESRPGVVEALGMVAALRGRSSMLPDETFAHYAIERPLGQGAQGTVFLATDRKLGRQVALKILSPGTTDVGQFFLRFKREAESASRVEHPNLCTVYEAGVHDGHPFIAMQYVEGTSLADVIASDELRTGMPVGEQLELVERVASGLEAAHGAGLTHRDVKPGNIILAQDGTPVLVDFGLARTEDADPAGLTQTGDLRGTPAYMAPEQIRGDAHVDHRADVYALGVVLYELLTGERPFAGATWSALFEQVLRAEPERPRRVRRDLWIVLQTAPCQGSESALWGRS